MDTDDVIILLSAVLHPMLIDCLLQPSLMGSLPQSHSTWAPCSSPRFPTSSPLLCPPHPYPFNIPSPFLCLSVVANSLLTKPHSNNARKIPPPHLPGPTKTVKRIRMTAANYHCSLYLCVILPPAPHVCLVYYNCKLFGAGRADYSVCKVPSTMGLSLG